MVRFLDFKICFNKWISTKCFVIVNLVVRCQGKLNRTGNTLCPSIFIQQCWIFGLQKRHWDKRRILVNSQTYLWLLNCFFEKISFSRINNWQLFFHSNPYCWVLLANCSSISTLPFEGLYLEFTIVVWKIQNMV